MHAAELPELEITVAQRPVFRQAVGGQVDLHHRRGDLDVLDVAHEFIRQVLLADQLEVGALRVGVREHQPGVELLAILGHHARCTATLDADVIDLGAGPDIDALVQRDAFEGLRDAAHRATQVGPGAALAGCHAHGVVQLDVTRAGVAWAAEGADQAERARRACMMSDSKKYSAKSAAEPSIMNFRTWSSPGWLNCGTNSAKEGGLRRMY